MHATALDATVSESHERAREADGGLTQNNTRRTYAPLADEASALFGAVQALNAAQWARAQLDRTLAAEPFGSVQTAERSPPNRGENGRPCQFPGRGDPSIPDTLDKRLRASKDC